MSKPFKNLQSPTNNPNAFTQTKVVGTVPKKGDPGLNEEIVDEVLDHPPAIPWPAPKPLEQSGAPMRLKK